MRHNKAFWTTVQAAVDKGAASGQSTESILKSFDVTRGAYYSARKCYGWSNKRGESKRPGKFVEFAPAESAPISIRKGDIEIRVASADALRTALSVLEGK